MKCKSATILTVKFRRFDFAVFGDWLWGRHGDLWLVICTGNPRVFSSPYPYLLITRTHFTGKSRVHSTRPWGRSIPLPVVGYPGFVITNAKKNVFKVELPRDAWRKLLQYYRAPFTSPSWLQLPRHIRAWIDCDNRRLCICDRRSLPWLESRSTSGCCRKAGVSMTINFGGKWIHTENWKIVESHPQKIWVALCSVHYRSTSRTCSGSVLR